MHGTCHLPNPWPQSPSCSTATRIVLVPLPSKHACTHAYADMHMHMHMHATPIWSPESRCTHLSCPDNRFNPRDLDALDRAGRCVITDHGAFVLFNVYGYATGPDDPDRFRLKLVMGEVSGLRGEVCMYDRVPASFIHE